MAKLSISNGVCHLSCMNPSRINSSAYSVKFPLNYTDSSPASVKLPEY